MPELRWTLLIVGALFIAGLAWWEVRRQRQSPRQSSSQGASAGAEHITPTLDGAGQRESHPQAPTVWAPREPTLSFPDASPNEQRVVGRGREPTPQPRLVEVDDAAFERLNLGAETMEDEIAAAAAEAEPMVADEDAAAPTLMESADEGFEARDPMADTSETTAAHQALDTLEAVESTLETEQALDQSEHARIDHVAESGSAAQGVRGAAPVMAGEAANEEAATVAHSASNASANPNTRAVGAIAAGAPKVDWPGEALRKIVALRLVSAPAARFQGRAVRQALAAEGFILGKFDIFHKSGPDERAVLSAASLTKPGTFAVTTMDAQRFGGLSLFAVLPGPLPAQQAFDELLNTARNLNDRLQGALQDERGEPLTPVRSANIRQSLCDGGSSSSGEHGPGHTVGHSETRQ